MDKQSRRRFLQTLGTVVAGGVFSGLEGQTMSQRYAQVVLAEPGLLAYWRMEGDLQDAKGPAHGEARGKGIRFLEGPGGGQALALDQGRWVTMGPTPHLDAPETTVEFFFQLLEPPKGPYNPCLLAKRRASRETRFSIHVHRDLSRIDLWNGRVVTFV
ncbi:MAG TPA: twin-arginine translocation signal domain-containing protein, partial [Armatimonadetes bacterium]|nr:twin-arginine translocation signal domain-containing protein [Armatimonadota bacterium]